MSCRCAAAIVVLGTVALLPTAPSHAASPWSPRPWHGYLKLWTKWHASLEYQDAAGELRDIGAYHELSFNAYGELGLWRSLAVWVHAPLVQLFLLEDTRSGNIRGHLHPGDPTIGLRHMLWRWRGLATGVELGVRFPIAPSGPVQPLYADGAVLAMNNEQIGALRVGTGVFDIPIAIAIGYSWQRLYVAASFGYIVRTGGYAHDLSWSSEGGWQFARHWTARLRVHGRHPLPFGDTPRANSPSGIGNGTSYIGFAGEIQYIFSGSWAVGGVIEAGPVGVRRQSRGPVISLTLSTTF